jgi:carbon storage regulator
VLILNRRVGERVIIGSNVTVCILAVSGNQARIGIEAPRNVEVHREEVAERIKQADGRRPPPREAAVG